MLPLPQPEFENPSQPGPWLVKAKIAFGPYQRYKPFRHNVGETGDSQNMNNEEQGPPRDQPGRNLRNGLEVFHHGTLLLLVELPGPIELRCPLAVLPCPARYANIGVRTFSSSVVGGGTCANLTDGGGTVSGMDTRTVAAGSGAGFDTSRVFACTFFSLLRGGFTSCVFARTFFSLFRGGVTPEASRNSSKLNFRNASKRRRSGAACTSPLNPKYTVPS